MTIKSLELLHFRNYDKQAIQFGDGINILYGQNAQGKTNVLEALYIAATGKSHRTNNYQDLIKHDETGFELILNAVISDRETSIVIKYSKEKGRYAEINGIKRNKLSDILGTLNMILFSPETLEVVKGSPQMRRKFMDILLCQIDRKYLHYLQQYNILIKNKSIALKKGRAEKKYEDVIPIWNDYIANYGGKIAYIRMKTIEKLNYYMKQGIQKITGGKEDSELIYKTFCEFNGNTTEENYVVALKEKLKKGTEKEIQIAQCTIGIHRDDFEILLNKNNSRQYCSQGQQRTLALSLILSELLFIEEIKGEKPVLLLDDVMSELDAKRQEFLVSGLYDVQTIITTTDDVLFDSIREKHVQRYLIENGRVIPKNLTSQIN